MNYCLYVHCCFHGNIVFEVQSLCHHVSQLKFYIDTKSQKSILFNSVYKIEEQHEG